MRLLSFEFYDMIDPIPGDDVHLATTLLISGKNLYHEPNECCWCEPDIIEEEDYDGASLGFTILHRRLQ